MKTFPVFMDLRPEEELINKVNEGVDRSVI